jgi:hypothetical protein
MVPVICAVLGRGQTEFDILVFLWEGKCGYGDQNRQRPGYLQCPPHIGSPCETLVGRMSARIFEEGFPYRVQDREERDGSKKIFSKGRKRS